MNKKLKTYFIAGCSISAAAILATSLSLSITSCSTNNDTKVESNKIVVTNNKYLELEKNYLIPNSNFPKFDNNLSNLKDLIKNCDSAIEELNSIKNDPNIKLSDNENVWLESYISQWNIKKDNIIFGLIFLNGNPIKVGGARVLSTSSNNIRSALNNYTNMYESNPETGDPDTSKPNKDLLLNLKSSILTVSELISSFEQYLKFGITNYGIQPSNIAKKQLVRQLLQTYYTQAAQTFMSSSETTITLIDFLSQYGNQNSIYNLYSEYESNCKKVGITPDKTLEVEFQKLGTKLTNFIKWYGTEYYKDARAFGGLLGHDIVLSKSNVIENAGIENNWIVDGKTIYGLGLTEREISTNNVGIGFMNVSNFKPIAISDNITSNQNITGNDMYQQMLRDNNSINKLAKDIYLEGVSLTKAGIDKMHKIAESAIKLVSNDDPSVWNPSIWYDADGLGPENPAYIRLTDALVSQGLERNVFTLFNIWLNQENFFFGRETFGSDKSSPEYQKKLKDYIDYYWNNPKFNNLKNNPNIQSYVKLWENKPTVNGLETGTVTGNQSLAGAVASFEAYLEFQSATKTLYTDSFNEIPWYVIAPYDSSVYEDVGVGLEGPRGSNQFQYNASPYYSLQKWSVSTLTNHEGAMGHHTQQAYWTKYMPNGEGLNNSGPGYTFVNDAFHEGWAVFAEWFGTELGTYGTWDGNKNDANILPTNWLNANGIAPKITDPNNITKEDIMKIKSLHSGVYYELAKGENEKDKALNAIKLANQLQYFGYLNEAQLRNMRLSLDTAYHLNDSGSTLSELPFGASIAQVRKFMSANSGLGIGDIKSESLRYLVMPSQATGYMTGKILIEDLYQKVKQKVESENSYQQNYQFINDVNQTRKFFDLVLRNGEIPLNVLERFIISQYNLK